MHRSKHSCGIEKIRQIDYVIVGIKNKWRLQIVFSSDDLYVGDDHGTLAATFQMDRKEKNRKKQNSTNKETVRNLTAWEPFDKDKYAMILDKHIIEECSKSEWSTKNKTEKMEAFKSITIQLAIQNETPKGVDSQMMKALDVEKGSKWYRERHMYKETFVIAKKTWKLTKKLNRDRIKINVNHIVKKFKGLK